MRPARCVGTFYRAGRSSALHQAPTAPQTRTSASLVDSGLPIAQAADSLLIIDGYVRSSVQLALQYAAPGATETWVAQLRAVLEPDRFPTVCTVLESGAFEDGSYAESMDRDFDFGLTLLLDGIEQLVER